MATDNDQNLEMMAAEIDRAHRIISELEIENAEILLEMVALKVEIDKLNSELQFYRRAIADGHLHG